jgi:hypothetical protein
VTSGYQPTDAYIMSTWIAAAFSAAAWIAVVGATVAYRWVARLGRTAPAAAALGLFGVAASALTIVTALGAAYPNGQLSGVRQVAAGATAATFLLFAGIAGRAALAAATFRYTSGPSCWSGAV